MFSCASLLKGSLKAFMSITTLLTLLAPLSDASTAYWELPPNRDYPGQCVADLRGGVGNGRLVLNVGDSWRPTSGDWACTTVTCSKRFRASNFTLSVVGCGSVGIGSDSNGCQVVQDLTLQYPECCPKVVCQDDNSLHSDYDYEDDGVEVWSGSNAASAPDDFVSYDVDVEEETTTTTTTPKPRKKGKKKYKPNKNFVNQPRRPKFGFQFANPWSNFMSNEIYHGNHMRKAPHYRVPQQAHVW